MTDSTQLAHVGDSIDRLSHEGVNHNEVTADVAYGLLNSNPTVQAAVLAYIADTIGQPEFDAVVNTAVQSEGTPS
jgi:hypothetical protein